MGKADVLPSQVRSQVSTTKNRGTTRLRRYWDVLAVLLFVLASFPAVWLSHRAVTLVPNLGLIDDNWHLDSAFKALRGIWIGRDVAFTHGPIFQWLSSIPARTLPLSFGGVYATWNTLPLWCAILLAYLAARLLLPEQPAWKRFVLLLLACSFWELSLRTASPVLYFAVFLRGWYAVREGRLRPALAGVAGALLLVIAFLVAGDTGIYATAAWVICFAACAFEMRRNHLVRDLLFALVAFVMACALLAVVVNCFTATPFHFKFWRDSFAQISAYRWATPAAMTREGTVRLIGGLLIGGAVFLLRTCKRDGKGLAITHRTAFLLGAFVLGLAEMQSALVRSDVGHVIIGEFAMIFFAAVMLFSFRGKFSSPIGVLVAIAACLLSSHPVFRPSSIIRLYGDLRHPRAECPQGRTEYDGACYVEALTPQMLTAGANFLSQHSSIDDSVFVFPYQTMFGLAARRNVAGGLMQAYTASGSYLSRLEIAGLEGKSIPAALYLPDDDYSHMSDDEIAQWSRNYLSVPVDGIPNLTRTPEVWFWMVRRYHFVQQLTPGVVALQRDDARAARIGLQGRPLGLSLQTYTIDARRSTTKIGAPTWPAGFDFIHLRMTVRYSVWWKFRKPERLQLEITRADGSRDLQWFILQPNVASDVWFYPWRGPELARYFSSDEKEWRPPARPSITNLRIIGTPLDWVSVQPESITIEAADAVRLTLSPR